jgi:SAM-dependent methyltransferase
MTTHTTSYYDGPEVVDRIRGALAAAGLDPDHLRVEDLSALDQFHGLGLPATLALAELADVRAGERVLDVGAGIGGPARVLAGRGAHVVAVEPTARFRRLAEALNAATASGGSVEIVAADGGALPFPDATFDLVWTQALLQSVSDLDSVAREAHRVLVPGGRWVLSELAAGPGGALRFPVPWGDSEADSHLLPPEALREALERPGFAAEVWQVGADAVASAQALASRQPATSRPAVTLAELMPDFEARMAGVARNVAERRVVPVQGLLRRGA